MPITSIKKRDGRIVPFDVSKISMAIKKAFDATYKPDSDDTAASLAEKVVSILEVEGIEVPD